MVCARPCSANLRKPDSPRLLAAKGPPVFAANRRRIVPKTRLAVGVPVAHRVPFARRGTSRRAADQLGQILLPLDISAISVSEMEVNRVRIRVPTSPQMANSTHWPS